MSAGEQPRASSLVRARITAPVTLVGADGRTDGNESASLAAYGRMGSERGATPPVLPSSVIHELRTPLTSIHGYAQVLQRTLRDQPRAANALGILVRESARLSGMLAELSELSHLESSDVVVTPIDHEVDQIVDGVAQEIARRDADAHPIEVRGTAVGRCSPTLLSQALAHVLTNAIRYSAPGERVSITVERHGSVVAVTVADRGIGVAPADDERIYEPFTRGANAREAGVRGLGLGLYLARRGLQHLHGAIGHEARPGGGTCFRITIPSA